MPAYDTYICEMTSTGGVDMKKLCFFTCGYITSVISLKKKCMQIISLINEGWTLGIEMASSISTNISQMALYEALMYKCFSNGFIRGPIVDIFSRQNKYFYPPAYRFYNKKLQPP